MKKILLLLMSLFLLLDTTSAYINYGYSHSNYHFHNGHGSNDYQNNYNQQNYNSNYNQTTRYQNTNISNGSCKSGRVGPYSYPALSDGNTYSVTRGNTVATLICGNGYVSIQSSVNNQTTSYQNTNINNGSCKSGRVGPYSYPALSDGSTHSVTRGNTNATLICRNGYVSIKNSVNNNTNNYHNNISDGSCKSGRVGAYSYPTLSDGSTHSVTRGNTKATLICRNGYVSINDIISSYVHTEQPSNNGSCRSGRYGAYSYPKLNNGETFDNRKNIKGGYIINKLICNNGYVSLSNSQAHCQSGYYNNGNTCTPEVKYNNSCYAGSYGGYYYPDMSHNSTYTVKRKLNNRHIYKVLECNNGNISIKRTYGTNYNNNRFHNDSHRLPLPPLPPLPHHFPFFHF